MRLTPLRHWLALLVLALSGCAATVDTRPQFDLAQANDDTFAQRFAHERQHQGGRAPRLGLALSGGGTKAALFAHGVLHGLNDSGLLNQVDAISSVSGGGYAAFWYFSKQREAQRLGFDARGIFADCFPAWWEDPQAEPALQRVFEKGRQQARAAGQPVCDTPDHWLPTGDPLRWQAHLPRWPDVFRADITPLTGNAQSAPVRDQVSLLLSALFEITLGWTGIESQLVQAYQAGIERAWGLNPLPRGPAQPGATEGGRWAYSNARLDAQGAWRVDPSRMGWRDLQALAKARPDLPLWVLNTNAGDKGDSPNLGLLYELTPWGHGSPALGYRQEPPPLDSVATGVRAAAAFADSQGLSHEGQRSLLNAVATAMPAARWGVKVALDGQDQARTVRLSDGGGTDNLGLLSLVRREVEDIVLVDAAQDPQGLMDDLCWAGRALAQEGLEMRWPHLERFDTVCAQHLHPRPKDVPRLGYNVSAWRNPVLPGEVRWPDTGRVTRLWLIKAAWHQQAIRHAYRHTQCGPGPLEVPCQLLLFYGHNTRVTLKDGHMVCPQHGTASSTLNGSAYLTWGYRELGRMLATRLRRDPSSGALVVMGHTACAQPAHPVVAGGRSGSPPLGEGSPLVCPD